jgi:hypothetical protein
MRKATYLLLVMMLLASSIAACGPTPEPVTIIETVAVEKEVPVTVEVEREVPVEVTRIVEVPAGAAEPAQAEMEGPVTLEVYDPTGAIEVTELFSARLDSLEGKTICEVSNSGWEARRTFPLIRELLQQAYPTATIIPYTDFPEGTHNIDVDEIGAMVKEKGCEAAILGNAG